jgi:hypothetical protein
MTHLNDVEGIVVTEDGEQYTIAIDDQSEVYQQLMQLGRISNPSLTDEEAVQLGLEEVIKEYVNDVK